MIWFITKKIAINLRMKIFPFPEIMFKYPYFEINLLKGNINMNLSHLKQTFLMVVKLARRMSMNGVPFPWLGVLGTFPSLIMQT